MPVEDGELTSDTSIATFTNYLWTIIYMPMSLRVLCVTNLFCWMSLVCYSLYFTDFVGEAVFQGDPSVSFQSPFFESVSHYSYYGRLHRARRRGDSTTKESNSVVGEWPSIHCPVPSTLLPSRNWSNGSGTAAFAFSR